MSAINKPLSDLQLADMSLTLVIASGGSRSRFQAWKVIVTGKLEKELLDICEQTKTTMSTLQPMEYDPDANTEAGECVAVPYSGLIESTLIETLSEGPSLEALAPGELRSGYSYYAMVFGPGDDPKAIFIKKANPVKTGQKSFNVLSAIFGGNHALDVVRTPEVQIHNDVDVVVLPGDMVIAWDGKAFEKVFHHEEYVKTYSKEWIQSTFQNLSGIAQGDGVALEEQALLFKTVRDKWHALALKGPLSIDEQQRLQEKVKSLPSDARIRVENGVIEVTPDNVHDVFGLINEDDFVGEITGRKFRSQRKKLL